MISLLLQNFNKTYIDFKLLEYIPYVLGINQLNILSLKSFMQYSYNMRKEFTVRKNLIKMQA